MRGPAVLKDRGLSFLWSTSSARSSAGRTVPNGLMGGLYRSVDIGSHNGYIVPMVRVGVRELRNKLSRYLRLVRQGETVLITDRDEVVAEIRQRKEAGDLDSVRRYLEAGSLSGTILPASRAQSRIRFLLSDRTVRRPSPGWETEYTESRADR